MGGVISFYKPTTTLEPRVLGFVWCTLSHCLFPNAMDNQPEKYTRLLCAFIQQTLPYSNQVGHGLQIIAKPSNPTKIDISTLQLQNCAMDFLLCLHMRGSTEYCTNNTLIHAIINEIWKRLVACMGVVILVISFRSHSMVVPLIVAAI